MGDADYGIRVVICSAAVCRFGKTPCMATIDEEINIDKFNECFHSHEQTKWREATKAESETLQCIRCKKAQVKVRTCPAHRVGCKCAWPHPAFLRVCDVNPCQNVRRE